MNSSQIPDWFDLSLYDQVENFGICDWASALSRRSSIRNKYIDSDDTTDCNDEFSYYVVEILRNAYFSSDDMTNETEFIDEGYIDYPTVESMESSYVSDDALFSANEGNFENAILKAAKREIDSEATKSDTELLASVYDLHRIKSDRPYDGFYRVVVNLRADDEKIISDFRRWLKTARDMFDEPMGRTSFSNSDMHKWFDYQILPYLDLTLWAKINKTRITLSTIARALFPDETNIKGFDPVERIRKTTRPKAEYLLRPSVILALRSQAQREANKNKL